MRNAMSRTQMGQDPFRRVASSVDEALSFYVFHPSECITSTFTRKSRCQGESYSEITRKEEDESLFGNS